MRKGLVVTLGVALVLSAVPAFAEAPLLSCMPDIVISDYDQTAQTADTNQWIFTDALDLDEYVTDADTTDSDVLWSFIDPDGTVLINGMDSVAAGSTKNPPAGNQIRVGDGVIDIAQTSGVLGASRINMVTFYASDGDKVSSQTVKVTSVNTDGTTGSQEDAVESPVIRSWTFDSNAEGFEQDTIPGTDPMGWDLATMQWAGGSLELTIGGDDPDVGFGGWRSPLDPATGIQPKVGCIMRARYLIRSSVATPSAATPGFRLHAETKHVQPKTGGGYEVNGASLDFIDGQTVQYYSFNIGPMLPLFTADRLPGGTAKEFAFLAYPNQVPETLLSSSTLTYFELELLDVEGPAPVGGDAGTLYLDSLIVDGVDRPEPGTAGAQAVSSLTISTFALADWNVVTNDLDVALQAFGLSVPTNKTGLLTTVDSGDLAITIGNGNQSFETYLQMKPNGARLVADNYYRVLWTLTATVGGTNNVEPRVRLGLISENNVWAAIKEQQGGAAIAGLTQEPQEWEHWVVAPGPDPRAGAPAGMTEPMLLRFSSWQLFAQTFPVMQNVAGTVKALSVLTEGYAPLP